MFQFIKIGTGTSRQTKIQKKQTNKLKQTCNDGEVTRNRN